MTVPLRIEGLCYRHRPAGKWIKARQPQVLRDVDLRCEAGEIVGVLGRNGAGKTTLMQLAMGMRIPESGSVRLMGHDPVKEPVAARQRVGYVAEDQILPGHRSTAELCGLYRELFPGWDDSLAESLAQRFNLPTDKPIAALSKGQARQAALLLALAHRPALLLLDEPAGGLDPAARRSFLELAAAAAAENDACILFSSHHVSDVERLANRVVLIDEGRIALDRDLVGLHESACIGEISEDAVDLPARLQRELPSLLRARRVDGLLRLSFDLPVAEAEASLAELGLQLASPLRPAHLEDLFIELVERDA